MMQQQQIHVKNNFQLFIPLGGGEARGFAFTQTTAPSFGLTLTKTDINESWHYQVQLIKCEGGTETITADGLSWAKRSPYRFQTKANSTIIEGLILQLKVEPGVFDFRRVKHNAIRFHINCFSGTGKLLSTGSSTICKLLPKRRVAEDVSGLEPEVVVPIQWHVTEFKTDPVQSSSEPSPNYYSSPYEDDDSAMMPANNTSEGEGSFEAFESPEHVLDIDYYPINERQIMPAPDYLHDEHFMVLYNGNAEVIGNFRALNFYKASDINIKEDIKLLALGRNPRDVLMKIDGVEYKFKEGVRGNNDSNRRFVGYIAQQIESVVPQAVQLIDGILHVDYESLIPYLSESIKQNFKDIDRLHSKTDQIHQVVDMLYTEFMKKEQRKRKHDAHSVNGGHVTSFDVDAKSGSKTRLLRWLIGLSIATLLVVSAAIGFFFVLPYIENVNGSTKPLAPISPPASPGVLKPPSEPLASERIILEELYNATNGSYWQSKDGWLSWQSICKWEGVQCNNDSQRVTSINLTGFALQGTIPESLGDFEFLEHLVLATNKLSGTLPAALTKSKSLKFLDLGNNKISGALPKELFSMSNLVGLYLTGNLFTAWEIPAEISQMNKLRYFYVEKTNLQGTIPQELADLPSLESVQCGRNNLHGTLPVFSGTSLIELGLALNHLSGPITSLTSLMNLESLVISYNNFTGEFTLPTGNLENFSWLGVDHNHFTSVSPDIFNASMPSLFACNVSSNELTCPLPLWMLDACDHDTCH